MDDYLSSDVIKIKDIKKSRHHDQAGFRIIFIYILMPALLPDFPGKPVKFAGIGHL